MHLFVVIIWSFLASLVITYLVKKRLSIKDIVFNTALCILVIYLLNTIF